MRDTALNLKNRPSANRSYPPISGFYIQREVQFIKSDKLKFAHFLSLILYEMKYDYKFVFFLLYYY